VALAGFSHAEVDVGRLCGATATRAHRPERFPRLDDVALVDIRRLKVEVRSVEAVVRGANRNGEARGTGRAGERDCPGCRGADLGADRRSQIDPTMLAGGVRVVAV
jgi:hypothetical protein